MSFTVRSRRGIQTWMTTNANGRGRSTLEFTQAQDPLVRVAFDLPREKRSPTQRRALVELMMARDPTFRVEFVELKKLRTAEPKFVTTMVVQETIGSPCPTNVHFGRGLHSKGEQSSRVFPAVLPPLANASAGDPADPIDLARWLVDRRNPLTARVVVDRIWQDYFGRGLVETDNDFGTQGSPPVIPSCSIGWPAS